jgi:hypothetical protein
MRQSLHPSLWFVFGGRQKDRGVLEKRELAAESLSARRFPNQFSAAARGSGQLLGAKTKHKFGQMPYSELAPRIACGAQLKRNSFTMKSTRQVNTFLYILGANSVTLRAILFRTR